MSYWAVNQGKLEGKELAIESRRRVGISKGDHVVFFCRDYKSVEFTSYGRVAEVKREPGQNELYEQEEEGPEEWEGYIAIVRLVETVDIESPLTLDGLAYSLLKVYRYTRPYMHFRRQYVSLSRHDFETITTGSVFWSRTAFGIFFSELSKEQRALFMQELSSRAPSIALQSADFILVWETLKDFIEAEYISAAELMKEIRSRVTLLQDKVGLAIEYAKLGISSDDASDGDLISTQEERLARFLSVTRFEEGDVFRELQARMEQSKSELRFQKLFRGQPWPIQEIGSF